MLHSAVAHSPKSHTRRTITRLPSRLTTSTSVPGSRKVAFGNNIDQLPIETHFASRSENGFRSALRTDVGHGWPVSVRG